MKTLNIPFKHIIAVVSGLTFVVFIESCTPSSGSTTQHIQIPSLPVLEMKAANAVTYREFPVSIEGKRNIEVRPQVDGYLEEIYVDEGAYVQRGQALFRINDLPYKQQLLNARAALHSAEANYDKAVLEVDRIAPLVENNVVSEIQMKSAKAGLASADASVAQARAMVSKAEIDLGYTIIKAPVNGYIGRIPMKAGSLVGRGEASPLTVLSDIKEVYAYFSLSEVDFLQFSSATPGTSLEDKLKNLSSVELVLPDGSVYAHTGSVETVEGQFNRNTGAISFRAKFPNEQGLLRSGSSGRVRIPSSHKEIYAVPQESTFELQDKVLVFVLSDSNKVVSKPIRIKDQNDHYYLVEGSFENGQKIVYTGLSRLRDGAVIAPEAINADSLFRIKPL